MCSQNGVECGEGEILEVHQKKFSRKQAEREPGERQKFWNGRWKTVEDEGKVEVWKDRWIQECGSDVKMEEIPNPGCEYSVFASCCSAHLFILLFFFLQDLLQSSPELRSPPESPTGRSRSPPHHIDIVSSFHSLLKLSDKLGILVRLVLMSMSIQTNHVQNVLQEFPPPTSSPTSPSALSPHSQPPTSMFNRTICSFCSRYTSVVPSVLS